MAMLPGASLIFYITAIVTSLASPTSFSIIKSNKHCHRNDECSLKFLGSVLENHSEKVPMKNISPGDTTRAAIARDPCILTKVVSYFDRSSIRLIISRTYSDLADKFDSCQGLFGRTIKKSVSIIRGNENDFRLLKQNALEYLSRDVQCFVIMCSEVCSSFILNIAEMFGFGVSIYLWITIAEPAVNYEAHYPDSLMKLTLTGKKSQSICSFRHFGKSNHSHSGCFNRRVGQYFYGTQDLDMSEKEEYFIELIKFPTQKIQSLPEISNSCNTFPLLAKRTIIRVVLVTSLATKSRPDLLNRHEMVCLHGLVCWVFPRKNGSVAEKRELSCCLGFVMDILIELRKDMHVDFYIYEVGDRSWGAKVNGSWNGLIGNVLSGKADIAADLMTLSHARLAVVDFTESYLTSDIVLVAKIQVSSLPYLNAEAFAALSVESWILIAGITLFTGVIIYWAEKMIFLRTNFDTEFRILEHVAGLFFQRDVGGLLPIHLGSRVISIALATTLMIIMSTYTAVLTTRNIMNTQSLPITGMKDPKVVHPTSNFKIATYKDSVQSQMFEQSQKEAWKRLGEFMKPYNFRRFSEAYEKLQRGTLDAVIVDRIALSWGWKDNRNCDVSIAEVIRKGALGFVVTKGSPWNEPISHLLRTYKENGMMEYIESKYMASKCTKKIASQPKQFSYEYLSGAFIWFVLGIIFSGCIFVAEYFYGHTKKRDRVSLVNEIVLQKM